MESKSNRYISDSEDRVWEQVILLFLETGSVKSVAAKLNLSVVKVRKILITEELWTSKSSAAIGQLYTSGRTVPEIAKNLCMTEKNVQAYIPYTKGLYNGLNRSVSALNSADYRKRIQIARERTLKKIVNDEKADWGEVTMEKEKKFDWVRLHLELEIDDWHDRDELIHVLHQYGGVKYGESISRDILLPAEIPLYALHYVIQRAFGWQNSHLHQYELPEERYRCITGDRVGGWMNLIGILFRSPLMDDSDRFWADDYEKGSFKIWLRKKYVGPYLSLSHGEGYQQCKDDLEYLKTKTGKIRCRWERGYTGKEYLSSAYEMSNTAIDKLYKDERESRVEDFEFEDAPVRTVDFLFENDPKMLLERLPISSVLAFRSDDAVGKAKLEDSSETIRQYVQDITTELDKSGLDAPECQPLPPAVTEELIYTYDYGDNWKVKITGSHQCADLIERNRLTQEELQEAINQTWDTYCPVCIAKDGCNLVDDAGGIHGFTQFLRAINEDESEDNGPYEDKESSLEWAKGLGWSKRRVSNKNTL